MEIDEEKVNILNALNKERATTKNLQIQVDELKEKQHSFARELTKRAINRYEEVNEKTLQAMKELEKNTEASLNEYYANLAKSLNDREEDFIKKHSKKKETSDTNNENPDANVKIMKNSINNGDIFYNGYDKQRVAFQNAKDDYVERCWQHIQETSDYVVRTNQPLRLAQMYYSSPSSPVFKRIISYCLQGAFAPIKFSISMPFNNDKNKDGLELEEDTEEENSGNDDEMSNSFFKRIRNAFLKKKHQHSDDVENRQDNNDIKMLSKEERETIEGKINAEYYNLWNRCLEKAELFGGCLIGITNSGDIVHCTRWDADINAEENFFLFKRYKGDFLEEQNKPLFFEKNNKGEYVIDKTIEIKGSTICYKNLFLVKSYYEINPYYSSSLSGWGASYFEDKISYCWNITALERSNVEQLQHQVKMIYKKQQMFLNRATQTTAQLQAERLGYVRMANSGTMDLCTIDKNDDIDLLQASYNSENIVDEIFREAGIGGIPAGVLSGKQESGALIATADDNIIDSLNLMLETLRNNYFQQLFTCLEMFLDLTFQRLNITDEFKGTLKFSNKGIDSVSREKQSENIETMLGWLQTLKNSSTDSQSGKIAELENTLIDKIKDLIKN